MSAVVGMLLGALVGHLHDLREILAHQARTDALTGLVNRATFTFQLQQMVERSRRTGELITVAYIGLDRFGTESALLSGGAVRDAAFLPEAEKLVDLLQEVTKISCLDQIGAGMQGVRLPDVLLCVGGREHHYRQQGHLRVGFERVKDFEAVHAGHVDVQQDDVGLDDPGPQHVQRSGAVRDASEGAFRAELMEGFLGQHLISYVVIDQEEVLEEFHAFNLKAG
ncbi:diguanylate cyclase domain-containing protein [Deinococcus malanensis]|uniref:diguanylate cyclase domain-containing protein n=1 Tax=Deinococcus malanensis TaxID=1706855 RepID=UPI00402B4C2C